MEPHDSIKIQICSLNTFQYPVPYVQFERVPKHNPNKKYAHKVYKQEIFWSNKLYTNKKSSKI